jgi:hypothetical protein
MGQAKVRSEEIKVLKSSGSKSRSVARGKVNLIAIKHRRDGQTEIVSFSLRPTSFSESKSQLLYEICNEEWRVNSMQQKIANYFSLTDSFSISKLFGAYGSIINFYESDFEFAATYSCRGVVIVNDRDSFQREVYKISCGGVATN